MSDFTNNLPEIQIGFIDNEGQVINMVNGEIYTGVPADA